MKKKKNGEIVTTETLDMNYSADFAGVTSSGGKSNTDVYIVIDKDEHIGGSKGKRYYLTTYFYSGYVDTSDKMQIADKTIPINLYFVK